ncbi:MAG: hypothetical protein V1763_00115 [Parcubacteria group bacterium]
MRGRGTSMDKFFDYAFDGFVLGSGVGLILYMLALTISPFLSLMQ